MARGRGDEEYFVFLQMIFNDEMIRVCLDRIFEHLNFYRQNETTHTTTGHSRYYLTYRHKVWHFPTNEKTVTASHSCWPAPTTLGVVGTAATDRGHSSCKRISLRLLSPPFFCRKELSPEE